MFNKIVEDAIYFYFLKIVDIFLDFKTQITKIDFIYLFIVNSFEHIYNAYLQISLQERTCPSMKIVILSMLCCGGE
jgi:hypothetical protein